MWCPPVEPSPVEQAVIKAVRRAKLFVFLRQHRHELFDEEFQAELAEAYADRPKGHPPGAARAAGFGDDRAGVYRGV
jgi:transposase